MKALTNTDFHFDGQKSVYHGKVRDVYNITLLTESLPLTWSCPKVFLSRDKYSIR